MSKQDDFYRALRALRANYRHGQVTMSHCSTHRCNQPAVGGKCRECCAVDLGNIIGNDAVAREIYRHIRRESRSIAKALDLIEGVE